MKKRKTPKTQEAACPENAEQENRTGLNPPPVVISSKGIKSEREHQFAICMWIAMGFTNKTIKELLAEKYEIDLSHQAISGNYRYGKKWAPVIARLRDKYLKNISRMPLASKGQRLAALQMAFNEAMTLSLKTITKDGDKIYERKIGIIPAIVSEARKEVEGEKGVVVNVNQETKIMQGLTPEQIDRMPKDELIRELNNRLSSFNS